MVVLVVEKGDGGLWRDIYKAWGVGGYDGGGSGGGWEGVGLGGGGCTVQYISYKLVVSAS